MRNSGFSELVSKIYSEIQKSHADHEDIDRFYAPEEIHADLAKHTEKKINDMLLRAGFTRRTFTEELVRRTSYKFAYQNDLILEVPHEEDPTR